MQGPDKVKVSYEGRRFRPVSASGDGDADGETLFDYHQHDEIVWGTYRGGRVRMGTLIARVLAGGHLEMLYQQIDDADVFKTGRCRSRLEILPDGRYRLHETWHWTLPTGGGGTSVVEELLPRDAGGVDHTT